jgi:uncharacterized protein GlcG (DUF336 family)
VVDAGGGLVAHVRMDGAWLGSVDISINKAWTARAFDMPTEKLGKMAQSGKPLFGIDSTNHEKVVTVFPSGSGTRWWADWARAAARWIKTWKSPRRRSLNSIRSTEPGRVKAAAAKTRIHPGWHEYGGPQS